VGPNPLPRGRIIAQADYLIDLGPGGGDEGGKILVAGDPLKVAACEKSSTGRELRPAVRPARDRRPNDLVGLA
jgi:excinuclease ABC subunit A